MLHVQNTAAGHELYSHLGGAFRELGIPVIAGFLDEKLLRSLREKPVQDLKTVLYANEFYPEFCARGFLALE